MTMLIQTINGRRFVVSGLLDSVGAVHAFGTIDAGGHAATAYPAIRAAHPSVTAIAAVHQEHGKVAVRPQPVDDLVALRGKSADIVVVRDAGLAACVRTADCVPVLIFDPRRPAAAAVHSGWKGTVAKAPAEAVRILVEEFGASASELYAAIGPCIGPCHYQVDGPVIEGIEAALGPRAGEVLSPDGPGRARLDLSLANRLVLEVVGLDPKKIDEARMCTFCRADLFYSYRRQGKGVPSLHHFIGLPEDRT